VLCYTFTNEYIYHPHNNMLSHKKSQKHKNQNMAIALLMTVIGMVCLAFASVPIYNVFCKLTGYGGTTQVTRDIASSKRGAGTRMMKVHFDANVADDLPWSFKPEQKMIELKTGENAVIFYSAQNLAKNPIKAMAVYNVTPHKAGLYFYKIQCFCFEEQVLSSDQHMMMPVSFFIDPDIESDPDLDNVTEITLSYRFFKLEDDK